jgi:predicted metalloendopeptidase
MSAWGAGGPDPDAKDTKDKKEAVPELQRFDPAQVDKSLDPCTDFFQYACSKWNKANPIPADQATWGTFNALGIWNLAAVRNTLEEAEKASANRTAAEQKARLLCLVHG